MFFNLLNGSLLAEEWKALAAAVEEKRPCFWAFRGVVDNDWNELD